MLKIVTYPHPALRRRAKPVTRINAQLRELVREMFSLMYDAHGIGLAANQVDVPLRLFVVNLAGQPDEGEERVYLNPEISRPKGSDEKEEGCLSLPETYAPVRRPERVVLTAVDLSGQVIQEELSGLHARVVQHETDHLDGILFVDRLAPTVARSVLDRLRDFEEDYQQGRDYGANPSEATIAERWGEWERRFCE